MRYQRPIGTQDITPEEIERWRYVEETFRRLAGCCRFGEIRTPIFEDTEVFTRSVGQETDIVSKEMYTFEDRGGRSITLRAEGTAPTVRAYLENNLARTDHERVVKLFYIAPIFRYDRPQAGRYRQHHQCGAEILGTNNPAADAEIIDLAWSFFRELGLRDVHLKINTVGCSECAPDYVQKVKSTMEASMGLLCEDCKRRFHKNPLRMLDCKLCEDYLSRAPKMADEVCGSCDIHFKHLKDHLDILGIPYEVDSQIVRGLDYYTNTAFEFQVEGIGAQAAIGGGGRYDGLAGQLGGKDTPGVGVGIGIERILMVREMQGLEDEKSTRSGVFVVTLGDAAWPEGVKLVHELRMAGVAADLDYRRRSLKAQMRFADNENFAWAVVIGEDEVRDGVVGLKDMESGEQQQIPRTAVLEKLG